MKNWINGEWVDSSGTETETVSNPATGETIAYVPLSTKKDVDDAVEVAKQAFLSWADMPVPNRARLLFTYLQKLEEHKEELAQIITMESGKTLTDARGKCKEELR